MSQLKRASMNELSASILCIGSIFHPVCGRHRGRVVFSGMHLGLSVTDEGLFAPACCLYRPQLKRKLLMLSLELIAELLREHFFSPSRG